MKKAREFQQAYLDTQPFIYTFIYSIYNKFNHLFIPKTSSM